MKTKIITTLFLVLSYISFGQDLQADQSEVLTNDAIVNMVTSKISKKIVLSKIESTKNNFDLSSGSIIKLAENQISDDVILAMLDASKNQPSAEVLTNEIVINMVTAKISKKIILTKIKNSSNNFDLKSDALIKLTTNKVSDDIVMAIMDAKKNQIAEMTKPVVKITPKKYNKPTDFSKINQPGIYYFDGNTNSFTKLDPNVFSQTKVSGGFLNSAVSSAFKVKSKATMNGSNANSQFNDQEVNFYFYFSKPETTSKEMERNLFESVESPNEFTLAKFKTYTNKNIRELELGSSNVDGASYGVNEMQIINFKYEKINQNLYRIYFPKQLEQGEYCFMPTINSSTQGQASKIFDFGITFEQ